MGDTTNLVGSWARALQAGRQVGRAVHPYTTDFRQKAALCVDAIAGQACRRQQKQVWNAKNGHTPTAALQIHQKV